MFSNPSQQNTPLDPRQSATPLVPGVQESPIAPAVPGEPVSTPIAQQPLESQGLPAGQVPGGEPMATPEQKAELQRMLDATREKMAELQTAKFQLENEKEVARVEALKEMFIMMRDTGVDLNDPASVGTFLDRLRTMNPSMSTQFEETLESLLEEDMPPESQQMGMNPGSFDEASPSLGMPDAGMPMPDMPAPATPPGPGIAEPTAPTAPDAPPPIFAPAPPSPMGPTGNETLS